MKNPVYLIVLAAIVYTLAFMFVEAWDREVSIQDNVRVSR